MHRTMDISKLSKEDYTELFSYLFAHYVMGIDYEISHLYLRINKSEMMDDKKLKSYIAEVKL